MTFLIVSFLTSLIVSVVLIRSASRHGRHSADHDLSGPQKFHARPVPRIGGVAVFAAVSAATVLAQFTLRAVDPILFWLLLAASLPAFVFGLAEDLTKSVSPRR